MLFVVRMVVSCNCLESDFGNKIGNEHLKADFILSHIYMNSSLRMVSLMYLLYVRRVVFVYMLLGSNEMELNNC